MKRNIVALAVAIGAIAAWFAWSLTAAPDGGPFHVSIDPGNDVAEVSWRLHEAGVIRSPALYRLAAEWLDAEPLAGRYIFLTGLRPWAAARLLAKGPPPEIKEMVVTFPEGTRLEEYAARLDEFNVTSGEEFLRLAHDARFVERLLGARAPSLEGFLFPDSYRFLPHTPAVTVIERLHQEFLANLPDYSHTGFSLIEFVTLASIVQREGLVDSERPRIAAVFLNRLEKGMKLEADPTVRFALNRYDTEPILYSDLDAESPYNTYRVGGLPPSPISSVGKASLMAVAHPIQSDELYFVATGRGDHYFAATHAEHLANKDKYKVERSRQLEEDR